MSDIIERLSSGVWSDRRDGLVALQTFLKSDAQLRLALCTCVILWILNVFKAGLSDNAMQVCCRHEI